MAKTDLEMRRNLFHLGIGTLVAVLLYFNVLNVLIILLVTIAGLLLSLTSRKKRVPVVGFMLERFERPDVAGSFPGKGATYLFLGILLSVALFPRSIALASIMILTMADSVPCLVGSRGRIRDPLNDERFLEGTVAGFLLAFIAASFFVSPIEAFIATAFSVVIESFEKINGRRIEDNVAIPLVAGLSMILLRMFI